MNMMEGTIETILVTLYEQTGFSICMAFLFMYLYKAAKENGIKDTLVFWIKSFYEDTAFRRVFLLAFYVAMILHRTLLNRNLWLNPLSSVFGSWTIYYKEDGHVSTEAVQNFILFIPFSILVMWALGNVIIKEHVYKTVIMKSAKYTFVFSACIECAQLFFRLGTFQISDLVYNTLGGVLGGIIYCMGVFCKTCGMQYMLNRKNRMNTEV